LQALGGGRRIGERAADLAQGRALRRQLDGARFDGVDRDVEHVEARAPDDQGGRLRLREGCRTVPERAHLVSEPQEPQRRNQANALVHEGGRVQRELRELPRRKGIRERRLEHLAAGPFQARKVGQVRPLEKSGELPSQLSEVGMLGRWAST
jgi:hypothetical protein